MKKIYRFPLFLIFILALAAPVFAQDAEYRLHSRRVFGYGNGSDIRGSFSLTVVGNADNIRSVTYRMDGKDIATITEAPYKFDFNTGSYPVGMRELSAVVDTRDGRQVTTPVLTLNFISAEQESQGTQKILVPLLSIVVVVTLIGVSVQFLAFRHGSRPAPGAARNYGLKGGAICPRCGRAFAIHFWSLNLIGGYLDACTYCGKWSFVRPRPRAELDAAVQAEFAAAQASESSLPAVDSAQTEEERLRKMMDELKYTE